MILMEFTDKEIMDLMQFSFTRLDGAWFLSLAKKMTIEDAWEVDVDAWSHFAYVFGKKVRKDYIPNPVWPESFIDTVYLLSKVLKAEGREVSIEDDKIAIRVTDCEIQKMIAKAGIADCGIVTLHTYDGIIRGLFAGEIDVESQHTKNLNHGDECCEVVIAKKS